MMLDVVVKTGARRFGVWMDDYRVLHVSLTEAPEKNKANAELVRGLSRLLGTGVRLIVGAKSKRKKIDVDLSSDEVRGRIAESG